MVTPHPDEQGHGQALTISSWNPALRPNSEASLPLDTSVAPLQELNLTDDHLKLDSRSSPAPSRTAERDVGPAFYSNEFLPLTAQHDPPGSTLSQLPHVDPREPEPTASHGIFATHELELVQPTDTQSRASEGRPSREGLISGSSLIEKEEQHATPLLASEHPDSDFMRSTSGLPHEGSPPSEQSLVVNPFATANGSTDDETDLFNVLAATSVADHIADSGIETELISFDVDVHTESMSSHRKSTAPVIEPSYLSEDHSLHEILPDDFPERWVGDENGGDTLSPTSAPNAQGTDAVETPDSSYSLGVCKMEEGHPVEADIAAMWEAALADDDLLDDEEIPVDPISFFPDDGEGFLDDPEEAIFSPEEEPLSPTTLSPVSNIYGQMQGIEHPLNGQSPFARQPQTDLSGGYTPSAMEPDIPPARVTAITPGFNSPLAPWEVQQSQSSSQRPDIVRAQSFADKAKGGYASPYDLPMDVRPKRRFAAQPMSRAISQQPAPLERPLPPRSSSMNRGLGAPDGPQQPRQPQSSPFTTSIAGMSPGTANAQLDASGSRASAISVAAVSSNSSSAGFFEDLPITTKPRVSGRYTAQALHPTPQPSLAGPPILPPSARQQAYQPQPPPTLPWQVSAAQSHPSDATVHATDFTSQSMVHQPPESGQVIITADQLRAPERINPYDAASMMTPNSVGAVSSITSRYSPAPPAPIGARGPARYVTPASGVAPPMPRIYQAHQPRTSSPLAHHTTPNQASQVMDQAQVGGPTQQIFSTHLQSQPQSDPQHESLNYNALNPPLPFNPISKYDKSGPLGFPNDPPSLLARGAEHAERPSSSRYAPLQSQNSPLSISESPVPAALPTYNYSPSNLAHIPNNQSEAPARPPPQRSQTQSPGRAMNRVMTQIDPQVPFARPASANGPISPSSLHGAPHLTKSRTLPVQQIRARPRDLPYVVPTDGQQHDPFERWKGAPIFTWAFGGAAVTSFPKETQRYAAGQAFPMIKMSPGQVQTRSLRTIFPLEDHLAAFPGPLKGKNKKKAVLGWLEKHIERVDQQMASGRLDSMDPRRLEERSILWKVLKIMISHDGVLEGASDVNQAIQAVLLPGRDGDHKDERSPLLPTGDPRSSRPTDGILSAEPIDVEAVARLRKMLLIGKREEAVWEAVDKRMWGHAMLISSTLSRDIWKQVVHEFVRNGVKKSGDNTESLAALYEVFAGNFEESVDELVPPSARAGFQMVSKTADAGPTKNALAGLDKWRESLSLILSNRSSDDGQAIVALGRLLASYGRIEAAHICYMFARSHSWFGGADEPQTSFVLVGHDHLQRSFDYFEELESILLSEVYEFGLSLSASTQVSVAPHLQGYKVHHAVMLAEFGYRAEAQAYCDAVLGSIKSTTKASPYYHPKLIAALDDLTKRLHQSPSDSASSWISKPTMGKISGSLVTKFHSFVSGEDSESASVGSGRDVGPEVGPFAKIAGGTPFISRPVSRTETYRIYGSSELNPMMGMTAPATDFSSGSRYTPATTYAPASTYAPVNSYAPGNVSTPGLTHMPRGPQEQSRSSTESYRGAPGIDHPQDQYQNSYSANGISQVRQQRSPDLLSYGAPAPQGDQSRQYQAPVGNAAQLPSPYLPKQSLEEPRSSSFGETYNPMHPPTAAPPQYDSYSTTNSREAPQFGINNEAVVAPHESLAGYQSLQESAHQSSFGVSEEQASQSIYNPPTGSSSYEPPFYQPYEPDTQDDDESSKEPAPKKKSFMDDDDDGDYPGISEQVSKGDKAAKDREAEENFKKAAAADAARDKKEEGGKKGWLGGWFGGKRDTSQGAAPIRAKLGEASSFYYDSELKKWVNKKGGVEAETTAAPTAPPPRSGPPSRAVSGKGPDAPGPPLYAGSTPPMPKLPAGPTSAPPNNAIPGVALPNSMPVRNSHPHPGVSPATSAAADGPSRLAPTEPGTASGPPSGPPSRPGTSMSMASSIEDLLGQPAPRKGGTIKKTKKGRGYVDVMAK